MVIIKNVIFDLGKVLINNDPSEYLRKYGYDEEKYQALLDAIWTDSLWGDMDVAKYESFKDIIEIYVDKHKGLEPALRRFFAEDWMELYVAYDDTVKFYNEVYSQGYDIYLLTNFSKDGYEYISNKFDFFKKAKGAVVSSHIKIAKPDIRIYQYLLDTYNLNPDECVFIDDSVANIKAASELGIYGIVYTDIENLRKEFNKYMK
ncbi:MAG: HAD family phosphatase [Clostridia bacterium]|nr:HAD family phosphatase [Clostridia bacterium]